MAATEQSAVNKTWELSLYELNRTPQEAITDNTEIAVSPRSLHSELMCPICLDMLKNTMTTKECLHRFCSVSISLIIDNIFIYVFHLWLNWLIVHLCAHGVKIQCRHFFFPKIHLQLWSSFSINS